MSRLDTYSASDRIAFVRSTVHLIGLACEADAMDALLLVTSELQQIEALVEKLEEPAPVVGDMRSPVATQATESKGARAIASKAKRRKAVK